MPPDQDRRQLLALLSLSGVTLPFWPGLLLSEEMTSSVQQGALTESESLLTQFVGFSQFLTGQSELNAEATQIIFETLSQELWGTDHLKRVLDKYHQVKANEYASLEAFYASLDEGERWFAGHVLTTWLTGMYFYQNEQRVLTYDQALMFEGFEDIYPHSQNCELPFGYWQQAPA